MQRQDFFRAVIGAGAAIVVAPDLAAAFTRRALPAVTVYKSPTCGCCTNWVAHMRDAGFQVKTIDMDDLSAIKRTAGVPSALESCHTALVGTYVVEGHVPADLVKKMLMEKPAIAGLSVPGMVTGSPGMEAGNEKHPYDVIAFSRGGKTSVFAHR